MARIIEIINLDDDVINVDADDDKSDSHNPGMNVISLVHDDYFPCINQYTSVSTS